MTEAEPEHLMVESVGLVSTLVEEHKGGGGTRKKKDLALIIVIIILPEISYLPYFTLETIPFSFRELNTDSEA